MTRGAMQQATFDLEQLQWQQGKKAIVGIDEVGRGSWAGPVVVAGVIFPPFCELAFDVADSKLLSPKVRRALVPKITTSAVASVIVEVDTPIINRYGIGEATHIAFRKVLKQLQTVYDFIFMDAFYIRHVKKSQQQAIIHGDALSASVAAASILAKVRRDSIMTVLDKTYPQYGFAIHKGYGTKLHQQALRAHGLSNIHRRSFRIEKYTCLDYSDAPIGKLLVS